jgi:hypothetical protein
MKKPSIEHSTKSVKKRRKALYTIHCPHYAAAAAVAAAAAGWEPLFVQDIII